MKKFISDFQKSLNVALDHKYSGSKIFLATRQLFWRLLVSYVFIVQGTAYAAADTGLWVSQNSDRSNPVLLEGQVLQGNTYIFLESDEAIRRVTFYLSNGYRHRERREPYDLAGGRRTSAHAFDTRELADGQYVLDARTRFSS